MSNVKTLNEQVVIITGAGRGLGASIAKSFAREGAKVAINYRNSKEQAELLADELGNNAIAVQGDVRDRESIAQMLQTVIEKLGEPTTLVHNALADYRFNGDLRDTIESLTEERLLQQHKTAVVGALNMIQAVVPYMEKSHFGRIITIGTNLFQNPVVPYHDYTSAKGALLALTRTATKDLGSKGISVNMVSGGLLKTTDASSGTPDEVFDFIAQSTPLGSVTTPDELADTVSFFASPWARAVTGQNLIVDGGLVFG
ncbi:3-oxoacyl-ACP reductase [Pasteurella atlantica]|uniref:3-oxoacyl-ACP reductase n=1 Tax=Pasteurellaceae TaxID=712 RepID=UPI00277342BE|nr:3-oxoacyl-ACP reductase [Pasteurella atlantica]MDP8033633.1 3-oxoacyl-ACP reductase [Pasteurella atlantica]MDP8035587.1 3-oxoacyl-ACP reductase [Pasteurella atlantica]MDP8037538.1 3-oxoacyl-ACP reductase [Pasteurella atlantica]MDP8047887.1 3-oxoacyl-ACP reductase [Pasteurella atlantica]MDP8049842.1 3-oxoacyl-ACP reductase [Pasteurella atlantica]